MSEPPTAAERPDQGPLPEHREADSEEEPRIYVASLSDYNAGRLHGAWINANQEAEELQEAINQILSESKQPIAEEWAIHDYEGFEPVPLSEYESIAHVSALGQGIAEHGTAFAHWAAYIGSDQWQHLGAFEDAFVGQWSSTSEFAESLLEDMGVDIDSLVDESLQPYVSFDVEAFARDLSYDYFIASDEGGVYVFDTT